MRRLSKLKLSYLRNAGRKSVTVYQWLSLFTCGALASDFAQFRNWEKKTFTNAVSWFLLILNRLCFCWKLRVTQPFFLLCHFERHIWPTPFTYNLSASAAHYTPSKSCLLGFMQTWTRAYPNQEMTPSFVANGKQWFGSIIYCRAFDSLWFYPDYQQVPPWLISTLPLFSGHSYNSLRSNLHHLARPIMMHSSYVRLTLLVLDSH